MMDARGVLSACLFWSSAITFALLGLGQAKPAHAFSAAQAEALTDPYEFPNVPLCCTTKRRPPPSYCERHPDRCRRPKEQEGPDIVTVDCGAVDDRDDRDDRDSRRHVFTSLQAAVDYVEPYGVIRIRSAFPGPGCVGHVYINKSLTIEGVAYGGGNSYSRYGSEAPDEWRSSARGYSGAMPDRGAPVTAVVDGCVSIWGPGRPVVRLLNLEILGTTAGSWRDCNPVPRDHFGTTGLEPPIPNRGENQFTPLWIEDSTLIARNVSVRSTGRAVFAEHSVIDMAGGNLAAHPKEAAADAAVWLLRSQVKMEGLSIAGGRNGVMISMLDRLPVSFTNVSVLPVRTQVGGVYPARGGLYRGETGVVVKLDYENLPSTPWHNIADFNWTGGTIQGYRQGIAIGPGVTGSVTNTRIVDPQRGAFIDRGAQVRFDANEIHDSTQVGLQIEPGAQGEALRNAITCADGECVCYGDDCSSNDRHIHAAGFALSETACTRDERDSSGLFLYFEVGIGFGIGFR